MLELNLLSASCTQPRDVDVKSEWTGTLANEKEKEEIIDYSHPVPVLKDFILRWSQLKSFGCLFHLTVYHHDQHSF